MAFAFPSASSRKILSVSDTSLASVIGGINYTFTMPEDSDTVVARFYTGATFSGTGPSATVYLQTSPDGGSTWLDVSNWSTTTAVPVANAHYQQFNSIGSYTRGVGQWTGSVQASTLFIASVASSAVGISSGAPIMGTFNRVSIQYNGVVSTNSGINVDIFTPTTQLR